MAEPGTAANDGTSATGGSARSEVSEIDDKRWRPRRGLAFAVSALTFLIPFVAATLAVEAVTKVTDRPRTFFPFVVWLLMLLVVATVVLRLVDRQARRLLPLATLLRLSLVFPDQAPSRFSLALKSGTGRALERAVADTTAEREFGTPQETAESVVALIGAVGRHDRLTRGHCERVRAYSDLIGQQLGLDEDSASKLHWAALLHDVGKLDVSPAILNKKGRLTPEEWEHVRQHPAHSDRWIGGLTPWLGEWVLASSQHHERFDGQGYPYGIAGMDISLAGRIVSVADAFDVMTAARSYKKPFPAAQARVELTDNAGSQFDPNIVRAFLAISVGELRRVMGPVAWLAALPELVRASVSGALAPARTAVIAAGVAAASLVPAVSAPMHAVITPAATAASGAATTFAAAEKGTAGTAKNDHASKTGADTGTAVPATDGAPGGTPGAGAATAATVTQQTSTTTSPTARPVTGPTSPPGGGGSSGAGQTNIGSPVTVAPVTTPSTTTTTTMPPTTTTTTPHTPVAASFTVTAHLNIKLSIDLQGGQTPKVTDADNNISWSTLTVTGRSAGAAADTITPRSNGHIDFTGPALVMGATWFDYRICDTTNRCATARVTVNLVSP